VVTEKESGGGRKKARGAFREKAGKLQRASLKVREEGRADKKYQREHTNRDEMGGLVIRIKEKEHIAGLTKTEKGGKHRGRN